MGPPTDGKHPWVQEQKFALQRPREIIIACGAGIISKIRYIAGNDEEMIALWPLGENRLIGDACDRVIGTLKTCGVGLGVRGGGALQPW